MPLQESLLPLARRLPPVLPRLAWRMVSAATVPPAAVRFLVDRHRYRELPGAEPLRWRDADPKLSDRLPTSPFDQHYFHQDVWAANRIAAHAPERHVDVGSRVDFVGFLTAICPVAFVDIRPLRVDIERLESVTGDVTAMPFEDGTLPSVSCLHVAEHIGLGRYGDSLDPTGSRRAAVELQRVVAPGGQLLFSGPVGKERVCFNAHRVHDPEAVVDWFSELELVEFASVDDRGVFRRHGAPRDVAGSRYACGMYAFRRPPAPAAG